MAWSHFDLIPLRFGPTWHWSHMSSSSIIDHGLKFRDVRADGIRNPETMRGVLEKSGASKRKTPKLRNSVSGFRFRVTVKIPAKDRFRVPEMHVPSELTPKFSSVTVRHPEMILAVDIERIRTRRDASPGQVKTHLFPAPP